MEGKVVYDEKTGKLVYKASLFEWVSGIVFCILIWAVIIFAMMTGSFAGRGLL